MTKKLFSAIIIVLIFTLSYNTANAGEQIITPSESIFTVTSGDLIRFDLSYSTANPIDETLTGIGVRLHFNSDILSFNGFSNVLAESKTAEDTDVQIDIEDYDKAPITDKIVTVAWTDMTGRWPGEGNTPAMLYSVSFLVEKEFEGKTEINITGDSAAGYTFTAKPIIVKSERQ